MNSHVALQSKSKEKFRQEIFQRLKSMSPKEMELSQLSLNEHLNTFLKNQKGVWGGFCALDKEVSPKSPIESSTHLQWAYPKVNQNQLDFYLNPKSWVIGAFKVSEPDSTQSKPISVQELQGLLIPGVAFDLFGNRLGRGLGYFDRALSEFKGLKVGLAWQEQIVAEELFHEPFDIPMDLVITNKGIVFSNINNKINNIKINNNTQEGRTQK